MGWTGCRIERDISTLEFIKSEFGEGLVAAEQVGTVVYGAALMDNGDIIGVVILTERAGIGIRYKDMCDYHGPHYYSCPSYILDKLSPPRNHYAAQWREKCRMEMAS